MPNNWIPEIMYEEDEGGVSTAIPFIMVPESQDMPNLLYIFESRETGEFEPGLEGEDVPVVQWDLHQYADMVVLKDGLDPDTYDIVRAALNLEPMIDAVKKGKQITDSVKKNFE
tara:strand:- start:18507 stop:18848 length:342 start_codon:yes stop_codon:yes gene_type:complete